MSLRALTKFLHSVLFLFTCAASPQLLQPNQFRSLSTIFRSPSLSSFRWLLRKCYSGVIGAFFPQKMSIHCHRRCLIRSVSISTMWRSTFYWNVYYKCLHYLYYCYYLFIIILLLIESHRDSSTSLVFKQSLTRPFRISPEQEHYSYLL